jgi:Tol biopolymer transport system component
MPKMRYAWLAAGIIVLAACAPAQPPATAQPTSPEITLARAQETVSPAAGDAVLAYVRGESASQLLLLDAAGGQTVVMDVPAGSTVSACGDEAMSPDGRHFAFYAGGNEAGTLYLITDAGAAQTITPLERLACIGGGLRFSPDSSRFAVLSYPSGASQNTFASGTLRVYGTADGAEAASYNDVTAFDVGDESVAYVSFFTNERGQADEAAVIVADSAAQREAATLLAEENCQFTSASVALAPDNNLALIIGHRCEDPATGVSVQWQLYTVDVEARSATLSASDTQPGAFVSFARTNNVVFSPDGTTLFFSVPDGVTANTAAVAAARLDDMSIDLPVPRQGVFPTFSAPVNVFPLVSRDGRWLTLPVTTPTGSENTLAAINLTDGSAAPITVSAGGGGDVISALAYAPDSSRLVYIAGGGAAENNSLLALDLTTGSETRVLRGRFAPSLAVSPTGDAAALADWKISEDPTQDDYTNLLVVNLASSAVSTLYEGATLVDGQVTDARSIDVLAWLKAAS